jgi:hypothetical protein
MPVNFEIKVRLTIDTLIFNPTQINFGKIREGTASRFVVTLENKSELPQEILFYPLPKRISYEPDLTPFKLLPREKKDISFIYRSREVIREEDFIVREQGFLVQPFYLMFL